MKKKKENSWEFDHELIEQSKRVSVKEGEIKLPANNAHDEQIKVLDNLIGELSSKDNDG